MTQTSTHQSSFIKFDKIKKYGSGNYGEEILNSLAKVNNYSQWMMEVIEPYIGSRILEVGAGIGNMTKNLPNR